MPCLGTKCAWNTPKKLLKTITNRDFVTNSLIPKKVALLLKKYLGSLSEKQVYLVQMDNRQPQKQKPGHQEEQS
jgi:hypothetical protein